MKKLLDLSVLLILVTALLACSTAPATQPSATTTVASPPPATATVEEQPQPTPTTAPAPDTELAATFEATPCPFDVPAGAPIDCGFVTVPEDHADPGGASIRLAVAVVRDQSADHQPDPIVLLCGGPGEECAANAWAYAQLFAPTLPSRDFILFDQRGVGLSEPALDCSVWEAVLFDLLDEADPEVRLRTSFEAVMACRDQLVSEGHNLSAYNTTQNAADVDAICRALGYDRINLYGGSYGSLLAQAVMRDHPEAIRSAVLWSVWPLEQSFSVEATPVRAAAIQRLLDLCAGDKACNAAYPDLEQVLFDIIERLNAEPVPIDVMHPRDGQHYEALLTGDAVSENLISVLYITSLIPSLPQAIYDVYEGDYDLMAQLTGQKLIFYDALSRGMEFSVICAEDLIGHSAEDLVKAQDTLPSPLRGQVGVESILQYGLFGICKNWPVEQAEAWIKEPLRSDVPTLVLEGELDPATPPAWGRQVAGHLDNSTYYEFPGVGHNIIAASECARSLAGAFVADPGRAPDATCLDEMAGLSFDVPGPAVALTLKPFSDPERGFGGLVPEGWQERAPANMVRASSALDPAYFVLTAKPGSAEALFADVTGQLGVDPTLAPTRSAQLGNFEWDFYTFEIQGHPSDLALTEDEEKAYFVFLISPDDEHDALYEQLFLPAVEAVHSME